MEQSLVYWRRFNPASKLQVNYQISDSTSPLVADELLLRQILSGFVMVVAQYIEPEGSVTLTVEEELACFIFTVRGTGKKVTPFSQLDLKMQGYLGRALVELQQGEIRLAEETDDGASIQFALPKS
jgi:K+-sensing histidine kinase KdpD